jgi:hypothetical protein
MPKDRRARHLSKKLYLYHAPSKYDRIVIRCYEQAYLIRQFAQRCCTVDQNQHAAEKPVQWSPLICLQSRLTQPFGTAIRCALNCYTNDMQGCSRCAIREMGSGTAREQLMRNADREVFSGFLARLVHAVRHKVVMLCELFEGWNLGFRV